ncbi:unnamed protein product [Discosporangium mesarthrocarpum]
MSILEDQCRAHLIVFHTGSVGDQAKAKWITEPVAERYGHLVNVIEEWDDENLNFESRLFEVWLEGTDQVLYHSKRDEFEEMTEEKAASIVDEVGTMVSDERILFYRSGSDADPTAG